MQIDVDFSNKIRGYQNMKIPFIFCAALLSVLQVLPVKAVSDGIPEFWDERRSMPVPDISHLCVPSEDEKTNMRKAVELLLYTELGQEYLWVPKTHIYEGLMEKMPAKLPYSFRQALSMVIDALDYQDLHSYPQSYDNMSPMTEMASRSWLILEAYCRKHLGFSLELESTKMMGRLRNHVWKGDEKSNVNVAPELLEQINQARAEGNRARHYELLLNIFPEVSQLIPGIGYKGTADDKTRQAIMAWYENVFISLVPSVEQSMLPPVYGDINRLDTNIVGWEFIKAGISFEGLPEKLQQLLSRECELAVDEAKDRWFAKEQLLAAHERNVYLIELVGMSLDEYCGFMWDTLQSLVNDPPQNGNSWSVHYGYRNAEEKEARNRKMDHILEQWRKQGMPEFNYLGQKELLFFRD